MKPGSVFCPGLCLVPSDVNSTCQKVGVESPGSHQGRLLGVPWMALGSGTQSTPEEAGLDSSSRNSAGRAISAALGL